MTLARNIRNNNGKEAGYDEWKKNKIESILEAAKRGGLLLTKTSKPSSMD